jgi:hypothetical protein
MKEVKYNGMALMKTKNDQFSRNAGNQDLSSDLLDQK